ncbi:hypothetical protein PO124_30970 [Bacillus licheniformis]|nr:hypothetical protein [Bacillus licheniformis]
MMMSEFIRLEAIINEFLVLAKRNRIHLIRFRSTRLLKMSAWYWSRRPC